MRDVPLAPLEGSGGLVVSFGEVVDGGAHLPGMGEAPSAKRTPRENAEPYLDLAKPGRMGGGIVEVHVLVARQPAVVLRFVRVQVVEDDVDLTAAVVGDELVHELKELAAAPTLEVPGLDLSRGHFQGGKEGGRAVAFVVMAVAHEGLAVGKSEPALRPFQGLNVGLLVHAQDQGVLGRIQVESHDVSRLGRERRVGADAPTPASLQMNLVLPKDAPDVVRAYVSQALGQRTPGPRRVPFRRRLVQHREDATLGIGVISLRLPGTPAVGQPLEALPCEARSPLADPCAARLEPLGNLRVRFPFIQQQDHPRPLHHTRLGRARPRPGLQGLTLFPTQPDHRSLRHDRPPSLGKNPRMGDEYNIYAYYCNQALVPGTPGRDAVVTDRNTGSEHSVEITWPIDGRHVIGQAKQMNKRGYTNLQIWDYDDLSRQQSAVARTIEIAHKKALRDYRCPGGSTIIFVFDS